ncbi:hypothetical protein KCP73_10455 [Salmonella enterica subsp. enterica]|nr:hypothetical protein KCP73_10455 [Salmonella enterica subsp. enterica]
MDFNRAAGRPLSPDPVPFASVFGDDAVFGETASDRCQTSHRLAKQVATARSPASQRLHHRSVSGAPAVQKSAPSAFSIAIILI